MNLYYEWMLMVKGMWIWSFKFRWKKSNQSISTRGNKGIGFKKDNF